MKRCILFLLILVMLSGAFSSAFAGTVECPILETGSYFPLKEPITLTALVVNTSEQLSVTNSYVQKWIKEKTNIDLQIEYEYLDSEGSMQLNLLMASGSKLPDILLCTRWSKAECSLYGARGLVIPLQDYLKDCPNWNRLTELCGQRHVSDLTMADGNIYCFGSVNECYHLTHQARMWVYQPWIDKLCGGKLPQTTEEFYDYLAKVATMDPNGNGIKDEIPLTGQINSGWATDPFTFLSNSFVQNNMILGSTNHVVAPGCYLDESGKVHLAWTEDAYRDALRYINRLYSEGLLDSQTYTQNNEQMDARLRSEPHLVGAAPGGLMPEASYGLVTGEDNDWKDWTCLEPLEGPDGVRLTYQSDYDYFYNCNGLITRDCEYPEIAAQLFDLLCSTEGTLVQSYGKENVNWEYCSAEDGVTMNDTAPLYRYISSSENASTNGTAGWPPDTHIGSSFLSFRNAMRVDNEFNGEQFLWDLAALYEPYSPGMESVFPNLAYTAEQSKQITQYTTTIENYVSQSMVQFITGSLSVESDWDAYLSMLGSLDLSGFRELLQTAYDASKTAAADSAK